MDESTEVNEHELTIDGMLTTPVSISADDFLAAFHAWLETTGWSFGGSVGPYVQESTDDKGGNPAGLENKTLDELALIGRIDGLKAWIHYEQTALDKRMQPAKDEVYSLIQEYSRRFSPLKPGDEIPYTPPGHKHTGIVRIIEAHCTLIPNKWQYEALILSVGEDASEFDKKYIGRNTMVHLNRNETPAKLN